MSDFVSNQFFIKFYFQLNKLFIEVLGVKVVKPNHQPVDSFCWPWFDELDHLTSQLKKLSEHDVRKYHARIEVLQEKVRDYLQRKLEKDWEQRALQISRFDSAQQPRLFYGEVRKLSRQHKAGSGSFQVYDPRTLRDESPTVSASIDEFKSFWSDYFYIQGMVHSQLSLPFHCRIKERVRLFLETDIAQNWSLGTGWGGGCSKSAQRCELVIECRTGLGIVSFN